MLRVVVFPEAPECLLVCAHDVSELALPKLAVPFTSAAVRAAGITRVTESVPGRWTPAMTKTLREERGERRQRADQETALQATVLRGATDESERTRAELIARRLDVDEDLRVVKQKIAQAKSDAFQHKRFLPSSQFRALETERDGLRTESIAIQARLSKLKGRRGAHLFVEAAKALLDEATYEQIWAAARGDDVATDEDEAAE